MPKRSVEARPDRPRSRAAAAAPRRDAPYHEGRSDDVIDATRTTTQLLDRLHDGEDAEIWVEFDRRYRPILVNFSRRLGLSEADAQDAAQETLTRFVAEYRNGKYRRDAGRLRSWLIGIARYRVLTARRSQAVRREARGESAMINLDDETELTAVWEQERRTMLLRQAMDELKSTTRMAAKTIEAFELLVLQQRPVAVVAESLGMSPHDVYLAKSRCAAKLRDIVHRLESSMTEA